MGKLEEPWRNEERSAGQENSGPKKGTRKARVAQRRNDIEKKVL